MEYSTLLARRLLEGAGDPRVLEVAREIAHLFRYEIRDGWVFSFGDPLRPALPGEEVLYAS